jgi:hypothetical protein
VLTVGLRVGATGKVEGKVVVRVVRDGMVVDVDEVCGGGRINAGKSAKLRAKLGG